MIGLEILIRWRFQNPHWYGSLQVCS